MYVHAMRRNKNRLGSMMRTQFPIFKSFLMLYISVFSPTFDQLNPALEGYPPLLFFFFFFDLHAKKGPQHLPCSASPCLPALNRTPSSLCGPSNVNCLPTRSAHHRGLSGLHLCTLIEWRKANWHFESLNIYLKTKFQKGMEVALNMAR